MGKWGEDPNTDTHGRQDRGNKKWAFITQSSNYQKPREQQNQNESQRQNQNQQQQSTNQHTTRETRGDTGGNTQEEAGGEHRESAQLWDSKISSSKMKLLPFDVALLHVDELNSPPDVWSEKIQKLFTRSELVCVM